MVQLAFKCKAEKQKKLKRNYFGGRPDYGCTSISLDITNYLPITTFNSFSNTDKDATLNLSETDC